MGEKRFISSCGTQREIDLVCAVAHKVKDWVQMNPSLLCLYVIMSYVECVSALNCLTIYQFCIWICIIGGIQTGRLIRKATIKHQTYNMKWKHIGFNSTNKIRFQILSLQLLWQKPRWRIIVNKLCQFTRWNVLFIIPIVEPIITPL